MMMMLLLKYVVKLKEIGISCEEAQEHWAGRED